MIKNRRGLGTQIEGIVADHLTSQGVIILEKNYSTRSGEIDIIAREGAFVVFMEVKYRATDSYGAPEEAVTPGKQRRICRVADVYRLKNRLPESTPIRFDVVAVSVGADGAVEINRIKNAFPYRPSRRIRQGR